MLKHTNKRNFTTATKYGKVTFDKDGISKDLTQEQQKELADVISVYTYEADTKSTAKKDEPKKEETKADDKEEAPKKTTTRKTTTRKTTAKKDTEDK